MKYLYNGKLKLENIASIRYIDWFLTTPFLIYSFTLYLTWHNNNNSFTDENYDYLPLSYIIPLNFAMLMFGFLGERKKINKNIGFLLGGGFFTATMYFIYDKYVKDKVSEDDLNVISKVGFGLFLWISVTHDTGATASDLGF